MTIPTRPILVVATTNAGKFREFTNLLGDLPVELTSLAAFPGTPVINENSPTYGGNATLKAVTIARWTRHLTLADDSGLEVDALGGAPGVHSARYAGPEQDNAANIAKLLAALADVPEPERTARFRCVVTVACPQPVTLTVEGTCSGYILTEPRGRGGFGYDPIFLHPQTDLSFAEMTPVTKNRVSHRAHACGLLHEPLLDFLSKHAGCR